MAKGNNNIRASDTQLIAQTASGVERPRCDSYAFSEASGGPTSADVWSDLLRMKR